MHNLSRCFLASNFFSHEPGTKCQTVFDCNRRLIHPDYITIFGQNAVSCQGANYFNKRAGLNQIITHDKDFVEGEWIDSWRNSFEMEKWRRMWSRVEVNNLSRKAKKRIPVNFLFSQHMLSVCWVFESVNCSELIWRVVCVKRIWYRMAFKKLKILWMSHELKLFVSLIEIWKWYYVNVHVYTCLNVNFIQTFIVHVKCFTV